MLPSNKEWEIIVSNLGIKNSDHIIIYDNSNDLNIENFDQPSISEYFEKF